MNQPYLKFEQIGMSFRRGQMATEVLRDVNLTIDQGEFVSLIGHSGCGKSTLLNIIAGLLKSTTGEVLPRRQGGRRARPRPRRRLPEPLAAALAHRLRQRRHRRRQGVRRDARARPSATTGSCTISSWCRWRQAKDKRPHEISGGMKQRVGIARALAMQPKVLLMDEPFGALDALTRAHLQDSVMEIHAKLGNTVLMITHDVDEAVLLSDRIVMMTNGPAATIGEILTIDLPRPRRRLELATDPEYARCRAAVLEFLYARHRVPARAAA